MEIYCNDEILSNIENKGIRRVFILFLRKDPTRTKSTKNTRQTRKQISSSQMFLCTQKEQTAQKVTCFILDAFHAYKKYKMSNEQNSSSQMFFMRIKMLYFLFPYVHFVLFMLNKRLSSSYMFFMCIKMLSFLFTYVLFVLLFVRVGSFCKKYKDSPNTLIYYTTYLQEGDTVYQMIERGHLDYCSTHTQYAKELVFPCRKKIFQLN